MRLLLVALFMQPSASVDYSVYFRIISCNQLQTVKDDGCPSIDAVAYFL